MTSRFASVFEDEILSMNVEAVPKNKKLAAKFDVTVFKGKLFISTTSYSKAKKTVEH